MFGGGYNAWAAAWVQVGQLGPYGAGCYMIVLMRADAAQAPEAALRLEYRLPGAGTALQSAAVTAAAASVGGLLLVLLGGWMIVGRRRQPR